MKQLSNEPILVDARKMPCPMPLLKLKQALNKAHAGDEIFLKATDQASKRDFKSFISQTSHKIRLEQVGEELHYHIIKGH